MTWDVQRASTRFVTRRQGWVGRYCFSYDEHYDPANVSFGRMLACNELVLEPGAGFGLHRHAGVDIVTTVLEGVLTHVTAKGPEERGTGSYLLRTGTGVEHDERNEGQAPVRFVQSWFVPGEEPFPQELRLEPGHSQWLDGRRFLLVTDGEVELEGTTLSAGDSVRMLGPAVVRGSGNGPGEALVWGC